VPEGLQHRDGCRLHRDAHVRRGRGVKSVRDVCELNRQSARSRRAIASTEAAGGVFTYRRAPIESQGSRCATRATPIDAFVPLIATPVARGVSLAMFRGPQAPSRDSIILATCTRQMPIDSLGLASDLVGTRSDLQVSLCDLLGRTIDSLALTIDSLITSQEAARCDERVADCTETFARSAHTNARCRERVARSSDRLAPCNDRVVRCTDRLAE